MKLRDKFHRITDYMRISVTDRCNLMCAYCMPSGGAAHLDHGNILTYEEIARVARVAAYLGIKKIRITGGEPLVRKGLGRLVRYFREINGIEDISLTTNGIYLDRHAEDLAAAGLDRVNVSLDSLRHERFSEITRGGNILDVLRGIGAAEKAGLLPVKINMIPIRGFNDDEIADFAMLTVNAPYHVRFIELMPIGAYVKDYDKYLPTSAIMRIIETIGPVSPVRVEKGGPARYYRFKNAVGIIGFISALSDHFCGDCNRLRLSPDGKLRPCLFSESEIDLKPALRNSASDGEIERLFMLAVDIKPDGHNISNRTDLGSLKMMSQIGG